MQTAAVILAAGHGRRFGQPKVSVRIGSRSMLGVVADTATAAGLEPVLAVVRRGTPVPATVDAVANDAPERGMSHSLRLGLAAVPPDAEAAVILLADQPTVEVTLVRRLLGGRGAGQIVAARVGGLLQPPVLLERDAFELVDGLGGDIGFRELLRRPSTSVTPVDWPAAIPDVDTPDDVERITEPCPGCGARFLPQAVDETHPYIGASPACWAAYGELLAREFGDAAYGRVHRQSADVYAIQHPGDDDRRQRQSVALHLIALCHWLEHDVAVERLNRITQRLASSDHQWPWLAPFPRYAMTVLDVLEARTGEQHEALVRQWAEATWSAWSTHHRTVRAWAREALDEE